MDTETDRKLCDKCGRDVTDDTVRFQIPLGPLAGDYCAGTCEPDDE